MEWLFTHPEKCELFIRSTFDPVCETFSFQFLLEFLIINEFLIYPGLGMTPKSANILLGWHSWSPCLG